MSANEVKQKKVARDAKLAKEAATAAAAKVKSDAELVKTITAKAQQYEQEYEQVQLFAHLPSIVRSIDARYT
jgi:serine/threonine protein kinase HipA of HipAB toxin-antitoxin module